jgi:hypothetical protein
MGDAADMLMDGFLDDLEYEDQFYETDGFGLGIDQASMVDAGILNEHGGWDGPGNGCSYHRPQPQTCKYCGKTGMKWVQTPEQNWRLASVIGGREIVHVCDKYKREARPRPGNSSNDFHRGFDPEDGSCYECEDGNAITRNRRSDGREFLGCTNFPRCRNTGRSTLSMWDSLSDDDVADLKWAFDLDY